jgi:hypothetical protein
MARQLALRAAALAALSLLGASSAARAETEGAGTTLVASYLQPLPSTSFVAKTSKASRAASLSTAQCLAEVGRRKLGVSRFKGAKAGVAAPVRVTGPINGVRFVTPGAKSPYGILDCRLALALGDLAEVLKKHDVVLVRVDNMYRPHAHLPGKKKPSQHSYGLAIDMTRFERADGSELVIERDFEGAIGEPVCGAGARSELSTAGKQLRDLICDVARSELFHHILTPNHDAAHRDHFHLDIARGARTRLIE